MKYDNLGNYVELRQGLAINKKTNYLVGKEKDEKYIFPLLRIADMMCGVYEKYISKDVNQNVIAHENDIIYTRTGQIGLVFRNKVGVVHNNSFIVSITNNDLDADYLYVILQSDFVKKQALKLANNSVQSDLTHEMFKSILIPVPEKNVQKKIASILLRIDEKIEINNSICDNLINYMRLVYDKWFWHFKKSNSSNFLYSEEIGLEIPEDWQVKKFNDLLIRNNDKYDTSVVSKTIDLSVMPSNSILLNELNISSNFSTNLFKLSKGDLLFGSIRPYLLKGGISPIDGAYAGTVYSFKPLNKNDFNFLVMSLFSDRTFNYSVKVSKGTKMPVVGSDDLLDLAVPYNEELSSIFNKINMKDVIIHSMNENQELKSLKEYLLPLLISGKLN